MGSLPGAQTQRECYLNTLTVIDQIGQFIASARNGEGARRVSAGSWFRRARIAGTLAVEIAPFLRGRISAQRRWIASFTDAPDVLQFVNSAHAKELAFLGTSCPDHFIRTKIRPLFVPWEAGRRRGRAEGPDCHCAGAISQAIPCLLQGVCHAGFAGAARCQPDGGSDSGAGHVQLWQEQDRGAHYRASSIRTRFT